MRTIATILASSLLFAPFAVQDPEPAPRKDPERPVVGEPAPAFRLNDHRGQAAAIGGAADGWAVLAFFPKAATPG